MSDIIKTTVFKKQVNIVMENGGLIPVLGEVTENTYRDGHVEQKVHVSYENAIEAVKEFNEH